MDKHDSDEDFGCEPCCVCGEKTEQRCSACEEAGFDLFFCSREHQKLVWSTHKRVCGPKSAPFELPLLTPDEAADARLNLDDFVRIFCAGATSDAPLFRVGAGKGVSRPELEAFIDSVTEGAEPPPPEVRITLNVVRAIRFARRQENGSTDLDPFDRLARFEHEVSRRLKKASLELSKEQQISLSALRHKIIISFALRQRYFSPNRPPTLETKHLISTHCGVLELLKNDLVGLVAAPQIAQEIRAAFTELFPVEKLFQPLPGQQQQQKKKKNKATRRR